MRVVIDTNVFVSGIFWKGPAQKILLEWRLDKFQMVLSAVILDEYRRVVDEISQKRGPIDVDDLLQVVGLNSILVQPADPAAITNAGSGISAPELQRQQPALSFSHSTQPLKARLKWSRS